MLQFTNQGHMLNWVSIRFQYADQTTTSDQKKGGALSFKTTVDIFHTAQGKQPYFIENPSKGLLYRNVLAG